MVPQGPGLASGKESLTWRVISAGAALPLLLLVVLLGSPWLTAVVGVVTALAVFEYYRLFKNSPVRHLLMPGLLWAFLFIANAHLVANRHIGGSWTLLLVAGGLLLLLVLYISVARSSRFIKGWLLAAGGPLYLGFTLSYVLLLRELEQGTQWLVLALFSAFATDTGAFFVGRAFGRHRMAPRISPGKTWEGAAAGLLAGIATALLLDTLFGLPLILLEAALVGLGASLAAQGGDLVESALKRYVGAKDTGRLIPGHGGVLDRLDSVVLSLVLVYYGAQWVIP